jgi:putative heme-binding domain-containing protein
MVFQKNCITCHRIGDLGVNVAPDIADSRTKQPDALLVSILDPNRAIDNNYFSYTVVRDDGKIFTGIISADTGSSITLRQPEDKTVTLLRDEIEEMKSDGVSLMPVGLEKNITVQDMADLISFIKNWRYLDGAVPIDVGNAKER